MPRVRRTLESQSLYIKMLEKLARDFEADLAKAKQIYKDLEHIEQTKENQLIKTPKRARSVKGPIEPIKKRRVSQTVGKSPNKTGKATKIKESAEPKRRGRPPKRK